ncbi:MAG TPA: DNA repair protein RecN [Jatrophihabitans sp.]|jgi:DNA repair protein RecN (Recombination protein N)|uniref:DNA repair protein RecN n=1 Tax=Jatrophihabitans sp. TaxID=1932789 RepID=UPI002F0C3B04
MLEEIRIRGLGVISDAVLELGPGLTVLSGETGAGKTMVVTGLALLFGGRADSSRLRPGVESASVEGRLLVGEQSPTALAVIEAGGDLDTDGSLVLRRVVTAAGRSRAVAGGASVPATVLARLAEDLVAVHGQSDQQRLTQPAEQRLTLDRYAGLELRDCRAAFQQWRAAVAELARRTGMARELAREAELLQHGIAEIARIAPQPGEDVELAALAARLEHADALRVAARTAHDALLGDPDDPAGDVPDVQTLIAAANRALNQVAGTDAALDQLSARLVELAAAATDIGSELAGYQAQLEADPARLASVHERRAALNGLIRKYGAAAAGDGGVRISAAAGALDAVLDWAAEAEQRLAAADTSDEALAALAAERDQAAARYTELAAAVSRQRREAAHRLSELITAELAGLAMPAATVRVEVRPRHPVESGPQVVVEGQPAGAGPDGVDEVEITLRPHPDAPALPVQRGASGGELSRVMLAIEVALAGTDPVPTMVFDEVDAGVGGRAAVEVGRRLARLARSHQVVVVTHLAQVAAFADRHLVVDKSVAFDSVVDDAEPKSRVASGGVTRSDIRSVTGEDRLVELARMLAGDNSAVAREHAAQLLSAARADIAGFNGPAKGLPKGSVKDLAGDQTGVEESRSTHRRRSKR